MTDQIVSDRKYANNLVNGKRYRIMIRIYFISELNGVNVKEQKIQ